MAKLIKPNDRTFARKEVRLVGSDGEQVGIVKFEEAQKLAEEAGLDVVLVAENANPAVCRIMDFGKLVYEQKKKVKDQKKHQHAQKNKEIKFRVNIDPHDYQIKVNHAIEFFEKGYKVKVTLMFRGREMAHKEIGFEVIQKVIGDLEEYATPDSQPKLMGRNISVSFSPIKGHH